MCQRGEHAARKSSGKAVSSPQTTAWGLAGLKVAVRSGTGAVGREAGLPEET